MISSEETRALEQELNNPKSSIRKNSIAEFAELCRQQKVSMELPTLAHNLHCHTFYSYNGYGYSPSRIAALARKNGWFAAGVVDFDVLDAVDEFLAAAEQLDLRAAAGIETRVFVPEFADREINSPGEPGVAYHLGLGFLSSQVPDEERAFLADLRANANRRTRTIVERVNAFLAPLVIDFETDAANLTPGGNVTERHVCQAYREKAEKLYPDAAARAAFWAEKLSLVPEAAAKLVADPVKLEGEIRSKTMKQGGVGYIAPTPESFPPLKEMNRFIRNAGAIPCIAWLNGLSAGEKDVDALLDTHIRRGAAMLNIIPDRNWNVSDPEKQKKLVTELDRIIEAAQKRDLPVVVGTEMNAPGQKLVDDFGAAALAGHTEAFVNGAALLAAHTLLGKINRGYLSDWAAKHFNTTADRNRFFTAFGQHVTPTKFNKITTWPDLPGEILTLAQA